jgi:hypothetical protein
LEHDLFTLKTSSIITFEEFTENYDKYFLKLLVETDAKIFYLENEIEHKYNLLKGNNSNSVMSSIKNFVKNFINVREKNKFWRIKS